MQQYAAVDVLTFPLPPPAAIFGPGVDQESQHIIIARISSRMERSRMDSPHHSRMERHSRMDRSRMNRIPKVSSAAVVLRSSAKF